jgi:hypothetical protein
LGSPFRDTLSTKAWFFPFDNRDGLGAFISYPIGKILVGEKGEWRGFQIFFRARRMEKDRFDLGYNVGFLPYFQISGVSPCYLLFSVGID